MERASASNFSSMDIEPVLAEMNSYYKSLEQQCSFLARKIQ